MRRRQLLRRGAVAVAAVLGAGCAEKTSVGEETPTAAKRQTPVHEELPSLPVEDRFEVAEREIETAAEADVADIEAFEASVEDAGATVEKRTEHDHGLELEVAPSNEAPGGTVAAVGRISGAYAAFVREDDSFERLTVTLLDDRAEPMGSFQVLTTWARRYLDEEWTAKSYGEAVLGTLKTKT